MSKSVMEQDVSKKEETLNLCLNRLWNKTLGNKRRRSMYV